MNARGWEEAKKIGGGDRRTSGLVGGHQRWARGDYYAGEGGENTSYVWFI